MRQASVQEGWEQQALGHSKAPEVQKTSYGTGQAAEGQITNGLYDCEKEVSLSLCIRRNHQTLIKAEERQDQS